MKVLDTDGLLYLWQKIKNSFARKEDLPGEASQTKAGLLSASDKQKLDGAENGAQANVIESVQVNGTALSVSGKSVNVSVPTNNNQLINGAGYQTAAEVTAAINAAVGEITQISYQKVDALPATGKTGIIYLVSHSHGTQDVFDEYIWYNNAYEKIGSTDIDLSGYLLITDIVAISNAEIDAVVAT